MKKNDHQPLEQNFSRFVWLVVLVAIVLTLVSLSLYQSSGTADLDHSLPKYIQRSLD